MARVYTIERSDRRKPGEIVEDHLVGYGLLAIIAFALAVRLLYFQGFGDIDDYDYIRAARALAAGTFIPAPTQWDVRIGLIAPTALIIRIFGLHPHTVALYPLFLSLCSLLLIYTLAATFFGRPTGLIAALLLACFPQDIYYSTLVIPDGPGATYGALAILLAYRSRAVVQLRTGLALCVGSGLALSMSYLTWEANMIFLPFCLLLVWYRVPYQQLWRAVVLTLTPLVVIALEMCVYWHVMSNPLFRLQALHHHTANLQGISFFTYLTQWPVVILNPIRPDVFIYVVLVLWAVAMLRRPYVAAERFLLLWLGAMTCFFMGAIISFHPLTTLLIPLPRYLSDVAYPALILAARVIYTHRPQRSSTGTAGS